MYLGYFCFHFRQASRCLSLNCLEYLARWIKRPVCLPSLFPWLFSTSVFVSSLWVIVSSAAKENKFTESFLYIKEKSQSRVCFSATFYQGLESITIILRFHCLLAKLYNIDNIYEWNMINSYISDDQSLVDIYILESLNYIEYFIAKIYWSISLWHK